MGRVTETFTNKVGDTLSYSSTLGCPNFKIRRISVIMIAHSCCEGTLLVEGGQTIVAVTSTLGEGHKAEGGACRREKV